MRRSVLDQLRTDHGALSGKSNNQTLSLAFTADSVMYKGLNFQPFRGRFEPWPPSDEIPEGVVAVDHG